MITSPRAARVAAFLLCVLSAPPTGALADEPAADLATAAAAASARGDTRAAVRALERLRYQGQLDDRQRLQLAEGYRRLGQLDQAAAEADRIAPAVGGIDLLLLRADLAATAGDWTRVRDLCIQVIGQDQAQGGAYLRLGQALQQLGDEAGADAAYAAYVARSH